MLSDTGENPDGHGHLPIGMSGMSETWSSVGLD